MSDAHLAYSEADTTSEMHADCEAVEANLRLERMAKAAVEPAPSILFEDYPREVPKPEITITQQAVKLANALHLHLD